ncbi:MAG: hypothetical protein QM784_15805 [Polyangiaceae bacterium]
MIYRACVGSEHPVLDALAIIELWRDQIGTSATTPAIPREFLRLAEGNISRAARLAGLPRTTFRTWLSRVDHTDAKPCEAE